MFNDLQHRRSSTSEEQGDDVTDDLKDRSDCFAHNFNVLNGELLGLLMRSKPRLFYSAKIQKNLEITKLFPIFFQKRFCLLSRYFISRYEIDLSQEPAAGMNY
jgi:hypothetical protein